MNKTEKIGRLYVAMNNLGLTPTETTALLRAERVLHRWAELECGTDEGHIERDEATGKPVFYNARARYVDPKDPRARRTIPDREAAALHRIACIMLVHPALWYFHQTDPRGCALYVGKVADLPPDSHLSSCYTRGIAVCI